MQGVLVVSLSNPSPKLDATDRVILACLGARVPRTEIAEVLGIDRVTIHRRLKRIKIQVQAGQPPKSSVPRRPAAAL